jgi:hypothetical protein
VVVGVAGFGPGNHQKDDAVLKVVAARSEKLSTMRCLWRKGADD